MSRHNRDDSGSLRGRHPCELYSRSRCSWRCAGCLGYFRCKMVLEWRRRSREKEAIRLSLKAELEVIEPFLQQIADRSRTDPLAQYEVDLYTSMTHYESVAGKIGILSTEEVEAVAEFYALISVLASGGDRVLENIAQSGLPSAIPTPSDENLVTRAERRRKTALQKINSKLDDDMGANSEAEDSSENS